MNQYELLYIVPSQYTDNEILEVQDGIAQLIVKFEGNLLKQENLGKIHLAYPVKKTSHGTYILVYFDMPAESINAFAREVRLSETVLRHTLIERGKNAMETSYKISSYVAPLSEEARAQKRSTSTAPRQRATAPAVPAPVQEQIEEIAPQAPSVDSAQESKMTMEELDKKLDEILEGDVS